MFVRFSFNFSASFVQPSLAVLLWDIWTLSSSSDLLVISHCEKTTMSVPSQTEALWALEIHQLNGFKVKSLIPSRYQFRDAMSQKDGIWFGPFRLDRRCSLCMFYLFLAFCIKALNLDLINFMTGFEINVCLSGRPAGFDHKERKMIILCFV